MFVLRKTKLMCSITSFRQSLACGRKYVRTGAACIKLEAMRDAKQGKDEILSLSEFNLYWRTKDTPYEVTNPYLFRIEIK